MNNSLINLSNEGNVQQKFGLYTFKLFTSLVLSCILLYNVNTGSVLQPIDCDRVCKTVYPAILQIGGAVTDRGTWGFFN